MGILKTAIKNAMAQQDIRAIYPVFAQANLFVVGKNVGGIGNIMLTQPPGCTTLCITVAEDAAVLSKIPDIDILPMTGARILDETNNTHEIMIYFDDGGYLLNRRQLDRFKELAANSAFTPFPNA